MKKFPASLISGGTLILLTIILFPTILGDLFIEPICIISLFCVLLAEVVPIGFSFFSNGSPHKVAAAVVSAFAIPAVVILSLIFISNLSDSYGRYIGWFLSLFLLFNAVATVLFRFGASRHSQNTVMQSAKNNMLHLRKLTTLIISDLPEGQHKNSFMAIEEKLHFSNDCVIMEQDEQIRNILLSVQSSLTSRTQCDVDASIDHLNRLIDTRTIMSRPTV